jgi:hypothetical protein
LFSLSSLAAMGSPLRSVKKLLDKIIHTVRFAAKDAKNPEQTCTFMVSRCQCPIL